MCDDVGVLVFVRGEEEAQGEAAWVGIRVGVGDVLVVRLDSVVTRYLLSLRSRLDIKSLTGRPVDDEKRARTGVLAALK